MKAFAKLLVVLAALAAAVVAFIYSGIYDVAATSPDGGLVEWALETTRSRSVRRRAEKVVVPPLDDPALVPRGLVHYEEMCVTCHGAPGVKASEVGMGLNPAAPDLAEEGEEAGELYWVIKNGIKMTGMPAFGATHADDEIWAIVAFVQRLHETSPEEYRAMVEAAGLGGPVGDHTHEPAPAAATAPGEHHHAPGAPEHAHGPEGTEPPG